MQIISKGFIIGMGIFICEEFCEEEMIESKVTVENVTLFYVHFNFAVSVLLPSVIKGNINHFVVKVYNIVHIPLTSSVKLKSLLICGCDSPDKLINSMIIIN